MYNVFEKNFHVDHAHKESSIQISDVNQSHELGELIRKFGGKSFEEGLYRIISISKLMKWKARIIEAFQLKYTECSVFGYDWLGRGFALDPTRLESNQPGVLMFDPGTMQVLEIPANLESFHDKELIEFRVEALSSDVHRRWLDSGGKVPNIDQCVGYKTPLFLNGNDDISNLEISDIDVYWSLAGQLYSKIRNLPPGTKIDKISIS